MGDQAVTRYNLRRSPALAVMTVALLSVFTAAVAAPASYAIHDGFHRYAVGFESSGGSGFTGVRVYRYDRIPTGIPLDGCSTVNTGHAVYQSQWVGTGQGDWVEIGSGHQCASQFRYWYWGYGYQGSWTRLGSQRLYGSDTHYFNVHRQAGTFDYYFQIDGFNKGSVTWQRSFDRVSAGLESYAAGADVDVYSNTDLKWMKTSDPGVWHNWGGRDNSSVDLVMCGYWLTDTTWQSGMGGGC